MSQPKAISWKQNLLFLWISQILAMAGFAAITPFVPLFFRQRYGITDEKTLGLWVAALTFFGFSSFALSAPLWGILADRYGRKLMLLRSYFVTALLFPLLYFMPNVIWFIAMRFMVSAFSGTVTAAQTLVVTNTPQEHQGFALGTLSTALWSGNMVGFLIGASVVNFFGFFWGFVICGTCYGLGGILTVFFVHEDFVPQVKKSGQKTRESIRSVMTPAIMLVLGLFVMMGVARRFDEPYIAILVEHIGGGTDSVFYTGLISAAAAAGGFLSGILMGKLCDRFSPMKVAVPSILLAAATMLIQASAATLGVLGGARFLHFTGAGGLEPAFQTILARISPPEKRGTLFGLASSLRMAGILLAALISGGVISLFGVRGVFVGSCVLFLCLFPLLFFAARAVKNASSSQS